MRAPSVFTAAAASVVVVLLFDQAHAFAPAPPRVGKGSGLAGSRPLRAASLDGGLPPTSHAPPAPVQRNPIERLQDLQEKAQAEGRKRMHAISTEARERAGSIRTRVSSTVRTFRTDVVKPVVKLIENPVAFQYGAVMSVRLSYFVSQQAVVSATVDRKLSMNVFALARAIIAAIGNGRDEEVFEALHIPDGFVTSKESYAWWKANLKGILDLLRKEARSMENGQYMFPYDMNPLLPKGKLQYTPPAIAASFAAYYASMAQSRRASKKANQAAMAIKAASTSGQFKAPGRYPSYFLQQNDILSDRQSKVMDYELDSQVWGMADAMRRRALVAVNDVAVEKDPESSSLLDVGAGTGRFLTFVKSEYPLLRTTALDLNLFNLQRAKSALKSYKGVTFLEANAENMPVEAESQDVVTCQFMLSRLPAEAQVNVINEMARVLKPGGKVVIIDATQTEFDGEDVCTFETLPTATLPPTYAAYQKSDLEYALIKAGLFVQEKEIAWVSKVLVAQKPPLLSQDPTNSGIYGVGF